MTTLVTITLAYHGLELRCAAANLHEDRELSEADTQRLEDWRARHLALARSDKPVGPQLVQLGQQLYDWLNGPEQFLRQLVEILIPPLLVEFSVAKLDATTKARAFIDAPWELLASEGRYWALDEEIVFCPLRRIGKAGLVADPSPNRLNLVFMAAAPRGADTLNYEAEEAAILRATQDIGLDLVVEESGTLNLLGACIAREQPDVVQISCHGTLTPNPGLLLEDDVGDEVVVKSTQLVSKLTAHPPRLLFLSACETAQADPVLDSLARALVRAGVPALLGWAAPVLDLEATLFAAKLYARLTQGEDLARALAYTRFDLAQSEELPVVAGVHSRDWHLARLYFNAKGGGTLASADGPRKHVGRGQAVKAFLDVKGKQVPVAGEHEFVGRRREIQTILRAFRAAGAERPAGVLIYGMGRQGKSSLAARIANRLEPNYELIVLYGRYDGAAILSAFRERLATEVVTEICKRYLPKVEQEPAQLLSALTELLEGPCQQTHKKNGNLIARPVLLVIDDFEQALEKHPDGLHRVEPQFIEATRALLQAFNAASTESRLLITSRYRFTLPEGGADLARHLHDVPLHGMDGREARKQAIAKLHDAPTKNLVALHERLARILEAGQGNPGLQNLLFSLCLQDPLACDRCLKAMQTYRDRGTLPQEDQVRAFLENLAIKTLLGLLSASERELLRASTLFELPVPITVMQALPEEPFDDSALERLTALGLWEVYEDLHKREVTARAVNALVRPQAGILRESENQRLAKRALPMLFACWGGKQVQRAGPQDHELTRLGLIAGDAQTLVVSAAGALRYLQERFEYRRAAGWAQEVVDILSATGIVEHVPRFLRLKGLALMDAAEYVEAEKAFQQALTIDEKTHGIDNQDVVSDLQSLTTLYEARGEYGMATHCAERATEIHQRSLSPENPQFAKSLNNLALICEAQGQSKKALAYTYQALDSEELIFNQKDKQIAITLNIMAKAHARLGEYKEAISLFDRAISIWLETPGYAHREVALICNNLGMIYYDLSNNEAAESLYKTALDIWARIYGDHCQHPEFAETINNLALVYLSKNQLDDAEPLLQRALEIWGKSLGENHPNVAIALHNLGLLNYSRKEYQEAEKLFLRAIDIWQKTFCLDNENVAIALNNLAEIHYSQGLVDDAINYGERALQTLESVLGHYHPNLLIPLYNLHLYFTSTKQHDKATLCLEHRKEISDYLVTSTTGQTEKSNESLDNHAAW